MNTRLGWRLSKTGQRTNGFAGTLDGQEEWGGGTLTDLPFLPLHFFQWAVVGDTFPVGCKVQDSVVFRDSTFHNNPDMTNPLYK